MVLNFKFELFSLVCHVKPGLFSLMEIRNKQYRKEKKTEYKKYRYKINIEVKVNKKN